MLFPFRNRARRVCLLGALLATTSGCAGYADHTKEARSALNAGRPAAARAIYNKALDVKTAKDLPEKSNGDQPLLVLERSTVSQSLDDYEASSQDLQYADKQIEMLDLSRTAVDGIGKYLFSDDTGPYQGAPFEKVMINTLNMANYLARHDLNGARIEARRMSIMQKYLRETENPTEDINAPGGYLAGFVFEHSGRPDIALRYYDEALSYRDFESLAEPIARLSKQGSYSTPRLKAFLQKHTQPPSELQEEADAPPSPAEPSEIAPASAPEHGELLVIINHGRVPAKKARRIPIGLALTYATHHMTGPGMSGANRLAAQGLVTWINFPDLEKSRSVGKADAWVDGEPLQLESAASLDVAARRVHEEEKGKIIAAAITRLVTRIVAGEATGRAVGAAADNPLLGILASLVTQASLTAADTPDTRSWSTLPARINLGRLSLSPGSHEVRLRVRGKEKRISVEMKPGGWEAVLLTVLR